VKLPEIPTVRKCYPHGYHKTDKYVKDGLMVVPTDLYRAGGEAQH
jgi:hypothetical protein